MQSQSATGSSAWICRVCGRSSPTGGFCPDDGEAYRPGELDTMLGTVVDGRFLVKELLGVGGWSRVYLAHNKRLDGPVVLKVLHTHLVSDTDKLKRFQREAEIASRMRHNNIGRVMDFGVMPAGQPYLVMEYLEGDTLNTLLSQKGSLEWQQVVQIINQAAEAFAHAHEQGVVHRDIKPSNLLLTKDGTVKVLDFGLAKACLQDGARGTSLTKTGQTMGTPEYMSPEQCLGQTLTAASDIYSLGLVAYELLTGNKTVTGTNTYELMKQHVDKPPPPFKPALRIPLPIQEAVLTALNKQPSKRYHSMRAMKAAFDPSVLPPTNSGDSSSNKYMIPVVSMLTLGAVVCGALGWFAFNQQPVSAPPAVPTPASASRALAPTAQPPATQNSATSPALAQPTQTATARAEEIKALEEKSEVLGRFSYPVKKRLAELYLQTDQARAMDTIDSILENRPSDDAMTALLTDQLWGRDPDKAALALEKIVSRFSDRPHVHAQCLLLLGDLFAEKGESKKAAQYYDDVAGLPGQSLDPYRLAATERVNVLKQLKLH